MGSLFQRRIENTINVLEVEYDGTTVEATGPRMWPIEWINFRCHPCTDWSGVEKYHTGALKAAPILVCRRCLVVLDGWHRLANWWREGRRYVPVYFTDTHLGGAKDECHVNQVNWISRLTPWAELECISGSYRQTDFQTASFGEMARKLQEFGDAPVPMMRLWEHVRATLFLGVVQGREILDVGTRESRLPQCLVKMGAKVTAVDLSTHSVVEYPGVTILQADATDLPFEDDKFDAVLSTACIKHIVNDTLAVSEMLRVLKPHRVLTVTVDFGQKFEEYPSKSTGRRIYDKQAIYSRLIEPFEGIAELCEPADFDRCDWDDWPIKKQAPTVFARGVNVQMASITLRKREICK